MGLAASAAVWVLYALVENVMLGGPGLDAALVAPEPGNVLGRLLAIVGILTATLLIQIVYARRVDIERALELERFRVRQMYENSPDRIACLSEDGTVFYTNLLQGPQNSSELSIDLPCYRLLYERSHACEGCALQSVVNGGTVVEFTEPEIAADGSARWFSKMLYPILRDDGSTDSVVEIARDVTDLHAAQMALTDSHQLLEKRIAERTAELTMSNLDLKSEIAERERVSLALRESEARFRQLIDSSPDMILLHSEGRIDLVNPAGIRMLGATRPEDVVGMPFSALWDDGVAHGSSTKGASGSIGSSGSGARAQVLRRLDGARVDVEMSETLVLLEGRVHVQCVMRDVTEAVQARETINRMAYFDSLTGLPNKSLFADRLKTALAAIRRSDKLLAVAFVDIDEFRMVNDSWGHAVGDAVLAQFAERLQSLFRENDTVSRYGSDEFAVLAELTSYEEANRLVSRIRAGLASPFRVEGQPVAVSVSLGIAITTGRGVQAQQIIHRADEALCRSKQSGPDGFEIRVVEADTRSASAKA